MELLTKAALLSALCLASASSQYIGSRQRRDPSGGGSGSFAGSSANAFSGAGGGGGVYGGGMYAGGLPQGFADGFQSYQDFLRQFHAQAAMVAAQAAQAAQRMGPFHTGSPGFAFYGFTSSQPPFIWSNFFPQPSSGWSGGNNLGGGVGASASGYFGPSGGQGSANIHPPVDPGLDVRYGDQPGGGPVNSASGAFPAPSGEGSFGVFTSSSSGQSSIDGKTTSFKTATVGVNDNGKVTTYTAHDP